MIYKFPKNIKLYYIAYNNTSGTPIFYDSYFQILQLSKGEIALRLPLKSCALKHSVTFILSRDLDNLEVERISADLVIANTVSITAKITSSTQTKKYVEINATLTNFSTKEWTAIIDLFINNQTVSDKLLNKMRGHQR